MEYDKGVTLPLNGTTFVLHHEALAHYFSETGGKRLQSYLSKSYAAGKLDEAKDMLRTSFDYIEKKDGIFIVLSPVTKEPVAKFGRKVSLNDLVVDANGECHVQPGDKEEARREYQELLGSNLCEAASRSRHETRILVRR